MRTLLASVLFLISSAPVHAQNAQGAWFPRYYVDARWSTTEYEVFYPSTPNQGATSPWLVVAGYQLTPRLAVQIGYAYTHDVDRQDPAYVGTTLTGQSTYGWRKSEKWTHAIPLTLRYELFRVPGSRLRVDVLGGYTWLRSRTASSGEGFINGQSQGVSSRGDHTTQSYVTLGLAARYVFSRHFEGVLEYGQVRNLQTVSEYVHLQTVGNKWGLTRSVGLGVRYRFNMWKPAR